MADDVALTQLCGAWTGDNTLHDPHTGPPDTSPSRLDITAAANGIFVRLDYTWVYDGAEQQGSLLVAAEGSDRNGAWVDSWHNGKGVMALQGSAADGAVELRGSYPPPYGPEWGWRIALRPMDDGSLHVIHHNVEPGGEESIAVEAVYHRA